ncbi:hypothetical protein WJX77_002076 [Trebouxia sp. C0004]
MFGGSVVGLSTLRQHQPKSNEPSEKSKELQAYLSKYTGDKAGIGNKIKKKRKRVARPQLEGVRIFEEDNTGFQISSAPEEVVEDAEDEAGPVVANPEEAERAMRQVQQLQAGGALEAWEEVPMIVGDVPKTSRQTKDSQDLSPPRRGRHGSPDVSPQRKRGREGRPQLSNGQGSADISRPHNKAESIPRDDVVRLQKRSRHDTPDASPPRKQRHDSSDASPPRTNRRASPDLGPQQRIRHDTPDANPSRKQLQASPDASPPRRKRLASPDLERHTRHDNPDASPPRRKRHDSPDASPPRNAGGAGKQDMSPPRKRSRAATADVAPDHSGGSHKPRFMPDGGRAGQVTGSELAAELKAKAQREAKQFAELGVQLTGRGADTVYRDKTGKRVSLEEIKAQQDAAKKPVAETPEWGGGMAQKREAEEKRRQMQAEAAKPFARRREDVDEHLRHRERFGDPMAYLVKKRPAAEPSIIPPALQKRMKKAGFIIPQEVPPHSWLKRNLGPPGNRYTIRPGRHWDGVDRSTGFEKDMFAIINERKNRSQEAHMWSQGDM